MIKYFKTKNKTEVLMIPRIKMEVYKKGKSWYCHSSYDSIFQSGYKDKRFKTKYEAKQWGIDRTLDILNEEYWK